MIVAGFGLKHRDAQQAMLGSLPQPADTTHFARFVQSVSIGSRESEVLFLLEEDQRVDCFDQFGALRMIRVVTADWTTGSCQWNDTTFVTGSKSDVSQSLPHVRTMVRNPFIVTISEEEEELDASEVASWATQIEPESAGTVEGLAARALLHSIQSRVSDSAPFLQNTLNGQIHDLSSNVIILKKWLESEERVLNLQRAAAQDRADHDTLEAELAKERNRRRTRKDVVALCTASTLREEDHHELLKQVDEARSMIESLSARLLSAEAELEASERSRGLLSEELKAKSEALSELWRASTTSQRGGFIKGPGGGIGGPFDTVESTVMRSELGSLQNELSERTGDLANAQRRALQLEQVLEETEEALRLKCRDFESLVMLYDTSEDRVVGLEKQLEALYQEMDGHYSRNLGLEKEVNTVTKRLGVLQEEYHKTEMRSADLALQLEAAMGELKKERRLREQLESVSPRPPPQHHEPVVSPTVAVPPSPVHSMAEWQAFERTPSSRQFRRASSASKARSPLLGVIIRDEEGRVRPGTSAGFTQLVGKDVGKANRRGPINLDVMLPKRSVSASKRRPDFRQPPPPSPVAPAAVRGVPPPPSLKELRAGQLL